jgi:hypothetical protein
MEESQRTQSVPWCSSFWGYELFKTECKVNSSLLEVIKEMLIYHICLKCGWKAVGVWVWEKNEGHSDCAEITSSGV